MVNVTTLRKELEFITSNPKMHDQSLFLVKTHCGTKGCLAGNAVANHKPELIVWENNDEIPYLQSIGGWFEEGAEILGLEMDQARSMFSAYNTLWDLWALAELFTNGEIEIPPNVKPQRRHLDYAYAEWSRENKMAIAARYEKELS